MAKKRKKAKTAAKTPVVKQAEVISGQMPCPVVYADWTALTSSYTGFRFLFSVALDKSKESVTLTPQSAVCMSAEHALQVYRLMGRQIELYEKRYGQIRELPDDQEQ